MRDERRERRLTGGTGHDGQGSGDVHVGTVCQEVFADELGEEFVGDGGAVGWEDLDLTTQDENVA